MKKLVIIVLTIGGMASPLAAASIGDLVKFVKPGDCKCKLGDLVQLAVRTPVVPGQFIEDIKVFIDGKEVEKPLVKRTSPGNIVGVHEASFFYDAKDKGDFAIKLVPIVQDKKEGKPAEYKLTVK